MTIYDDCNFESGSSQPNFKLPAGWTFSKLIFLVDFGLLMTIDDDCNFESVSLQPAFKWPARWT